MIVFNCAGLLLYQSFSSSEITDYLDEELEVEVIIKEKIRTNEYYSVYNGKIIKVYNDNKLIPLAEKTIVNLKIDQDLVYGTVIKGQAQMTSPKSNTNPGIFNYARYLNTKNIYSIVEFKEGEGQSIGRVHLSRLEKIKIDTKKYLNTFLNNTLKERNASILKGIILGEDSSIEKDDITKYRELGIAHILAISGLHIGIITGFLLFLLKLINVDYKYSVLITLIFVGIYGYIVDYPPSILRASIIIGFLMISRVIYRRPDYINILSFVALLLLIYQPLWIFDVGFQLSFICTFSIIVLTPRINDTIFADIRFGKFIAPILAAQIGIGPVLIYYFNYITLTSLIANLILIPILSSLLIFVIFVIGLSVISINIAQILMIIVDNILTSFAHIVDLIHNYLNIVIYLPSLSILDILIYYFLVYIFVNMKELKKIRYRYKLVFFISFIFLVLCQIKYNSTKWAVNFIDVGQGDSSLIQIKDKTFLIDTGGTTFGDYDIGENILIPYLFKKGINKIDGVFISHFHEDHTEGLISLLKSPNIKIDNIYFNSRNEKNHLYKEVKYLAKKKSVKIHPINLMSKLKIYEDYEFKLYTSRQKDNDEENNNTMIISFKSDENNILFMGDSEKELEKEYIKLNNEKFDIVKLGHHGSNTSTAEEFITHISPKVAIISVGNNRYGHPHQEVLNRLRSKNIRIYRTDMEGHISIKDEFDSFKVYAYRERHIGYSLYDIVFIIIFGILIYMNNLYLRLMKHTKERIYDI
ncbi:DNA internalization-related competence protein ComEC/Rec2 [Clostridium sp. D2Q-11]|uniref:DNA internalization-related competence protein ComEC/Rec2 n=2 Tax=Anaeromonas frigoriresistens TaxID=2683708 RepID=A0A942US18_9FIRM|nr:DNA internalization-related competence protein ComEC/Rec2 [Anaeromonas frigoriresistens]